MATYYLKQKSKKKPRFSRRAYYKTVGGGLIFVGLISMSYFFFPLFSYQLFIASAFSNNQIETPIPKYLQLKENGGINDLVNQGIASLTQDFTDARNWYPNLESKTKGIKVSSYNVSIPKLKIENAQVSTKDYDLSKHLVQYFGTSIPGEKGTAIIFGHSTLPQLFDPLNYKAIFATLHTLKVGDEINATVGEATYKYKIFAINITSPDDANILSQSYDNSYITLVTCTPPGTVWKRLIIRASLESIK